MVIFDFRFLIFDWVERRGAFTADGN